MSCAMWKNTCAAFPEAAMGGLDTEGCAGLWDGEQWPGDRRSEQGLTAGDGTFRFWGGDLQVGVGNYFSKKVGVVGTVRLPV